MQAIALIAQLASEFQDDSYVQITKSEWADYLNDAQRQIILVRPDASFSVTAFQLAAGTKQSIPSTGLRLLGVTRNMGVDGLTPGKPITVTDMDTMDLYDRNWHTKTGQSVVKSYMLDEKTPKTFFVTPPVSATVNVYIEAKLSILPTEITNPDTDAISLEDIYSGPLRHWMLHRAFSRETDSPGSSNQASNHIGWFYQALGIKTKTDVAFSPSVEEKE